MKYLKRDRAVENDSDRWHLHSHCFEIQYIVLPLDSHKGREYCNHPIGQ